MDREIAHGLGTIKWHAVSPASLVAVTAAEEAAATSLLGIEAGEAVFDQAGWTPTRSQIPAPDWLDLDTGSLPGGETWGTGSLMFYWVDATHPLFTLLNVPGLRGWITRGASGNATGDTYRVFPVRIQGCDLAFNFDRAPSYFTVEFALGKPSYGTFAA